MATPKFTMDIDICCVGAAFTVDPTNNLSEISYVAGDLALEQGIVAKDHMLHLHVDLVILMYNWYEKEMLVWHCLFELKSLILDV